MDGPAEGQEVKMGKTLTLPLSKLADPEDYKDLEFGEYLRECTGLHLDGEDFMRMMDKKLWEYAIGMYALGKSGALRSDAVALGIGSGTEPVIFYLANRLRYVIATDLYTGRTSRHWGLSSGMTARPWDYAPYEYDRKRLGMMDADGTDLPFPDAFFDVVFSYSSIEHFGSKQKASACLQEVNRVLKPGGVASITTEMCVRGADALPALREKYAKKRLVRYQILRDMFTPPELARLVLSSGMTMSNPIDLLKEVQETSPWPGRHGWPYLYLRPKFAPVVFTSVHMLLKKDR